MSKVSSISKQSKVTTQASNREKILQKKKGKNNDFWIKPLDGSVDRFKMVAGPDPCGPCTGPCSKPCSPCGKVCHPCSKPCGKPDPCNK